MTRFGHGHLDKNTYFCPNVTKWVKPGFLDRQGGTYPTFCQNVQKSIWDILTAKNLPPYGGYVLSVSKSPTSCDVRVASRTMEWLRGTYATPGCPAKATLGASSMRVRRTNRTWRDEIEIQKKETIAAGKVCVHKRVSGDCER